MTSARDFAADYYSARLAWALSPTISGQDEAAAASAKIVRAATRAGVDLYPVMVDIDDMARRAAASS